MLHWIYSRTCRFEVFVNNRAGKILRNTDRWQWHHVARVKNPADLHSRGIDLQDVNELRQFYRELGTQLQWQFLEPDPSEWNNWDKIAEPEESNVNVSLFLAVKTEDENQTVNQCVESRSSWLRFQRILAWSLRFARNTKAKKCGEKLTVGELTAVEM